MTGAKGWPEERRGFVLDGWKVREKGEKKDEVERKKGVRGNGTVGAEEKKVGKRGRNVGKSR